MEETGARGRRKSGEPVNLAARSRHEAGRVCEMVLRSYEEREGGRRTTRFAARRVVPSPDSSNGSESESEREGSDESGREGDDSASDEQPSVGADEEEDVCLLQTERERRAYAARLELYRHYRHRVLPELIRATASDRVDEGEGGASSDGCSSDATVVVRRRSRSESAETVVLTTSAGEDVAMSPDSLDEDEGGGGPGRAVPALPPPPPTPVQAFLSMVEREATAAYAKYGRNWGVFFRPKPPSQDRPGR